MTLSNILLTHTDEVRLADFGTVTGHTYLTRERLCVAYIRPPEATLGSDRKGAAVDSWAVALVALALWTGTVPTCEWPRSDSSDQRAREGRRLRPNRPAAGDGQ